MITFMLATCRQIKQALATHQTVPQAPAAGEPGRGMWLLKTSIRPILHTSEPALWTQLSRAWLVEAVPTQLAETVTSITVSPA